MEKIERNRYLEKLIKLRNNGQVKIITGIRRCGKSFLLNTIYRDYLLHDGVSKDQIIMLDLAPLSKKSDKVWQKLAYYHKKQ